MTAGTEVTAYTTALTDQLRQLGVPTAPLTAAAQTLAARLDAADGVVTAQQWAQAVQAWQQTFAAVAEHLPEILLGALADIPGLAELTADVSRLQHEGVHGEVEFGPVRLEAASATLYVQPPELADADRPPPIPIGPFALGEITASLASPFGKGKSVPGGGSIVRLPKDPGPADDAFGGLLQLPLGPVRVSATAILAMVGGGPSFLGILGVTFTPPIQLSFGFSLDRVGGIVGVNRRADVEALRAAVRTGAAADVLFSAQPPANALALVTDVDRLFPARVGSHLIGPSLKLSWLSFGDGGSLLGLDVAVVVEIPAGRVVILGCARAAIPSQPYLINLRLDVLGVIDPVEQLVSIDASLVDSHVLGIFTVYGDAAVRLSWGAQDYFVLTVGGFYPGFDPEPARLPALRRVGLQLDNPLSIIEIHAEGYFAITSNSLQFGGRLAVRINAGIEASGFIQVDALVQFRPFHFEARIAAGFAVSVAGFDFASVGLSGAISGPGPIVIRGSLSIDTFLFEISWDQTFTLGSGPADNPPSPKDLLDALRDEFSKSDSVQAAAIGDPEVVLEPRSGDSATAAVPPTGALAVRQRRAPLGVIVERLDGLPLAKPRSVAIVDPGGDVAEQFAPGGYVALTASEALSRPPFDVLTAGKVLSLRDPALSDFPRQPDARVVNQIVIRPGVILPLAAYIGGKVPLGDISALVDAAGRPPALSDATPLVTALAERWTASSTGQTYPNATAAHQWARHASGIAVAVPDAAAPVNLSGVL